MERIQKLIDGISEKNYFKNYLPIFRIYLSFHILKKIYLNMGAISIVFQEKYSFEHKIIDEFIYVYP